MSSISAIWLMCCWLPIPIWLALRNNARFKKNIVVGVTLPRETHDDEQITGILSGYRRQQLACAIALVVVALAGAAAGSVRTLAGPLAVCWSIWVLVACITPEVIFARTNAKLAALKGERGWRRGEKNGTRRVTVADIGAAAQPRTRISNAWFLLTTAASMAPALFDRRSLPVYLLSAAGALATWAIFRWCYRDRSEAVDTNEALTLALTRIRRRAWGRMCPLYGRGVLICELVAAPLPRLAHSVPGGHDDPSDGSVRLLLRDRDACTEPSGATHEEQRRGILRRRGRPLGLRASLLQSRRFQPHSKRPRRSRHVNQPGTAGRQGDSGGARTRTALPTPDRCVHRRGAVGAGHVGTLWENGPREPRVDELRDCLQRRGVRRGGRPASRYDAHVRGRRGHLPRGRLLERRVRAAQGVSEPRGRPMAPRAHERRHHIPPWSERLGPDGYRP